MTGYEDAYSAGNQQLLGIGAFSRYAGLSVRMLRHYDDHGMLKPAVVDPFTAYRRYTADQLRIAGRIRSLRDAGCGIPLIKELLPLYEDSPSSLRDRLAAHVAGLEEAALRLTAQKTLALALVADLDPSEPVVDERLFPATRVLQLHRTVADYPAEGELWAELRALMAAAVDVNPSAFGDLVGATYFDEEFRDDDVEMAIWREYGGAFIAGGGFEVVDLPAQTVASTTHYGGFDSIHLATESIGAWITTRGRTQIGPLFNVYVVGPGREPDPEKWVTEVNVPIG